MFQSWPITAFRGLVSTPVQSPAKSTLLSKREVLASVAGMLVNMGGNRGYELVVMPSCISWWSRDVPIKGSVFEPVAAHLQELGFEMNGQLRPILRAAGITSDMDSDFRPHETYESVIPIQVGEKLRQRLSRLAYKDQVRRVAQHA